MGKGSIKSLPVPTISISAELILLEDDLVGVVDDCVIVDVVLKVSIPNLVSSKKY